MHLGPPGNHQQTANPRDNRPIDSEDTHAKPVLNAKQLTDHHVVRCDPAYPQEHGQSLEEVVGEEEEEKGATEDVEKVSVVRYHARGRTLFLYVERVKQHTDDEVLRPDHARWPHQE